MKNISPTGGAPSVMVVGVDARGMGLLRECLGADAVLPPVATPYNEALVQLRRTRPQIVITGFDFDFDEAVRLGPLLTAELAGVSLVALSEVSEPDRIRAAMRAGYREYVVLPDDASLLRQAIKDAAENSTLDDDRGEVIAVCGSKGGVGVTSVSVNLAAELCPVYRALAVDLDFSMGDVAAYLDLQPPSDIAHVLRNLDRLDERLLAGSVGVHPGSKAHILSQPSQLEESEEGRGDGILRLLSVCARAYQYVVLDLGSHMNEATLTASSAADQIFLVCTPDVPAVKNAHRRLQLLDRLGVDRGVVRLLVNHADHKLALKTRDIEANLSMKVAANLAWDEKVMVQAVNEGRLARDINRRARIAQDFSELVNLVTHDAETVSARPAKSGPMSWLFS
jgi:pilus assembly protein CpaE